jgi:hypothetical protein
MSLRALIQFLVILSGVAFEMVRTGQGLVTPFVLHSQEEWFRSYVYYFIEHIKFITICLMMWMGARADDFKTDSVFVMLAVADFIDYILYGNNVWISITVIPHENGFGLILPISMNVFSLILFGLFAHREWKMNG